MLGRGILEHQHMVARGQFASAGTPNVVFGLSDTAREYRLGWRLTSVLPGDPGFEVSLDATRREAANGNEPSEHGVMLRGAIRW